jgi:MULE transposase domain/Amyotrophic lateral sclerosis 2 chromosomal region candidate gene 8
LSFRIDDRVRQYIVLQVEDGIINSAEVRRHTESFVKHTLFAGRSLPSALNRRFYPTRRDYVNIIYTARTSQMRSCVDQEELQRSIGEWQSASPSDKFMFRPLVEANSTSDLSSGDDDDVLLHGTENTGLLFVHQTMWQQRLLARYGQTCLLDATYRTTKYALPLFLICVRTNADYVVVGEFIVQFEDASSISDALSVIQTWNPQWKASSFMVDFCEAEINALESQFPGRRVWTILIVTTGQLLYCHVPWVWDTAFIPYVIPIIFASLSVRDTGGMSLPFN